MSRIRSLSSACLALALLLGLGASQVCFAATAQTEASTQPGAFMPAIAPADPALVQEGRALYMLGLRADGSELIADRQDAQPLHGAQAACVACHKRSGMGGIEGDVIVPPINGPSLYAGTKLRDRVVLTMDPRRGRFFNQSHAPYDENSLAGAVRNGVHVSGRPMHVLMPRYRVSDHEMAALKAYLDQLSTTYSPGITDKTARFATVITPDVDPARKDAFLKSLQALLDQKNSNTLPGHRHMVSASEGMLNLERRWTLDVWQLHGSPDTWDAQLAAAYEANPVFALLSGLGDSEWSPVQNFCETRGIPCWFPSIANPPANADNQTYSFYFQDGVTLEARVLAQYLHDQPTAKQPKRIVQIIEDDAASRAAAAAFTKAYGKGVVLDSRSLGANLNLAQALKGVGSKDVLVLWAHDASVAQLQGLPATAGHVYASANLVRGLFDAFNEAWRARLDLVYPYEMPEKRLYNMATFHSWIEVRHLPLADEAMQSEVFFSFGYLMYTMTEMLDNVFRDCLVDRGETMVRRREMMRAEEELMVRQGGHPPAKSTQARSTYAAGAVFGTEPNGPLAQKNTPLGGMQQGTTIYPHLDLATGQRFASKGAYLVHAVTDQGQEVVQADSDWIVP